MRKPCQRLLLVYVNKLMYWAVFFEGRKVYVWNTVVWNKGVGGSWCVFHLGLKTGNEWIFRGIMKWVGEEGEGWIICNWYIFFQLNLLVLSHGPNGWILFTYLICLHHRHNMFFFIFQNLFTFSLSSPKWMFFGWYTLSNCDWNFKMATHQSVSLNGLIFQNCFQIPND